MSTLLQSYEEEYREAVKSMNDEVAALRASFNRTAAGYKAPPATGTGSRLQRCSNLSSTLAQLKELLGNMEYECNDLPAALRQTTKERITDYRANIRKLEDTVGSVKAEASAADRLDLIGSANKPRAVDPTTGRAIDGELDDETRKHRMQMMENTDKVKQASNTLLKAERLLNDTETVGNEALTNLRAQTETMQHIHETTIAVDEEVSEARKILSGMQRVMIKHKLILLAVIMVLLFLIFVAIYVGVSKGNRNKPVNPSTIAPVDPIPSVTPTNPNDGGIPKD